MATLYDHLAQFLLMEFQTKQMDNEKIQMFRDFSKIENNENLVNTHLEGIDWATELQVNRNKMLYQKPIKERRTSKQS